MHIHMKAYFAFQRRNETLSDLCTLFHMACIYIHIRLAKNKQVAANADNVLVLVLVMSVGNVACMVICI